MLVEKSKGRKRSGDGGVGVKFLEEVEEEIRKKNGKSKQRNLFGKVRTQKSRHNEESFC